MWNNLSPIERTNFISNVLEKEELIADLKEYVLQLILYNELVSDWYEAKDKVNKKQWDTYSPEEQLNIIYNEIYNEWDKDSLIEFILSNMSTVQIEVFKELYEKE